MLRSTFLFVLALTSALLGTSAYAAGPFGTIHVGNWSGGAYTNDSTAAFSHCAAGASYVSGFSLTLGRNANNTWLLGIANPNWNLTLNETFPVDITFDGQAQFHIFANAVSPNLISAILPDGAANRFRKSHLMIAAGKVQTIPFELKSADKLMAALANCVESVKAVGVANAGDFSKVLAKPPAAPAKSTAVAAGEPPAPAKSPKLINITGTGFVISAAGHIVTNNHVIREPRTMTILSLARSPLRRDDHFHC
jgi:S1-C subfamily serine protease